MHRDAVDRLRGAEDIHVAHFVEAFPDSKKWMKRSQCRGHASTLHEFMVWLGYDGPPELLTMHLCLLLAEEMWRHPDWFASRAKSLQQAMYGQSGISGLQTVPALCVREAST